VAKSCEPLAVNVEMGQDGGYLCLDLADVQLTISLANERARRWHLVCYSRLTHFYRREGARLGELRLRESSVVLGLSIYVGWSLHWLPRALVVLAHHLPRRWLLVEVFDLRWHRLLHLGRRHFVPWFYLLEGAASSRLSHIVNAVFVIASLTFNRRTSAFGQVYRFVLFFGQRNLA